MRSKTYTAGANAERTAIRAYVTRQIRSSANGYSIDGGILTEWLKRRDDRYNKKPGGIGKGVKRRK